MATIRKRLGKWQSIVRVKGCPARTQRNIILNLFMPINGWIISEFWTEECTNCYCTSS